MPTLQWMMEHEYIHTAETPMFILIISNQKQQTARNLSMNHWEDQSCSHTQSRQNWNFKIQKLLALVKKKKMMMIVLWWTKALHINGGSAVKASRQSYICGPTGRGDPYILLASKALKDFFKSLIKVCFFVFFPSYKFEKKRNKDWQWTLPSIFQNGAPLSLCYWSIAICCIAEESKHLWCRGWVQKFWSHNTKFGHCQSHAQLDQLDKEPTEDQPCPRA